MNDIEFSPLIGTMDVSGGAIVEWGGSPHVLCGVEGCPRTQREGQDETCGLLTLRRQAPDEKKHLFDGERAECGTTRCLDLWEKIDPLWAELLGTVEMTDLALTHSEVRRRYDLLSDWVGDWQGIPVTLADMPLALAPGHPLREILTRPTERHCSVNDVREDEYVVNSWWSQKHQATVYVLNQGDRYSAVLAHVSPDRSMDRLNFWVRTIGACDAWGLEAEHRARETLRAMLTERQWHQYDLCGSFIESSPRSGLTYVFRRLRPTIALSPRWPWCRRYQPDSMRCLAVLCMHPIGYYQETWAGCMVPSDDVIAHLSWMRGDEAGYWKNANQHDLSSPEAGL